LRALGYRRRELIVWLVSESFLIGMTGILVGAFLDGLLFGRVRLLLGAVLPAEELVRSSLWISSPIWLTAVAAALCASIYPVIKLYRQDVHYCLRD